MHRSGTSMVTQLIAKWGAYMGNNLMSANMFNHNGYWEHIPLVIFHEKLLKKSNNTWFAPSEEIKTEELLIEFGDEAKQLVDQMDQGGQIWCWKDPRMTLFLDFWKEVLVGRDIVYILTNRHPTDIASSLFNRDKLPTSIAVSLWEFTTIKIIQSLSYDKRCFFIDFNQIISEPEIICNDLFSFLNASFQLPEEREVYKAMVRLVNKTMNHSNPRVLLNYNPIQKNLQRIISQGLTPPDFELPENHIWFLKEIFSLYRKLIPSILL